MARRLSLSSSPSSLSFSGPQGSISRSASLDKLPSYQYNDDSDNDFQEFQRVHFQEQNNNERNERNERNDRNNRNERNDRNDRNERNERNERENRNGRAGRFNIVGPPAASRPATPTEDDSPNPPIMKTTRSQSLPSGCELQRFHEYRESHAFAPSVVSNKEIKGDAGYIKHELIVALLAEVIGTAILISIGTGVILSADGDLLAVAIVWGFIVFGLIIAFGSVSGAHFNPCVTIAFFIINCRSHLPSQIIRLVTYIFAQMLGATLGASFTYTMLPGGHDVFFGTRRGPGVTIGQAYFIESFITFILIFNAITVYHNIKKIADKEAIASNDVITSPFATAFIVTLDVVYAGPYTGASLNPARSFGPALVTGQWDDQWLYWCAPITGAIVAVILYYGLNMDKTQRKIVKKFPRKVSREVSGRFHNLSRQNSPRGSGNN